MATIQANLEFIDGVSIPDSYDTSIGQIPPDNFIVTRNRDGSTASVFGDLNWDFSAYTPNRNTKRLNFQFWGETPPTNLRSKISLEIRIIIFCLIWRRRGAPLAIGTLANYTTVLCACANYADNKNITLLDFFCSKKSVNDFVRNFSSGWMSETLASLLVILAKIGSEHLGFIVVGEKCIKDIKKHNKHYRATLKQHPPMPTRIYSHFLATLVIELKDWLIVADDMLNLFNRCGLDPRLGRSSNRQPGISKGHGLIGVLPTFEELAPLSCIDYLMKNGKNLNLLSVSSTIGKIQLIAKLIIQAYTGMRDKEAGTLSYNCYEQEKSNLRTHHFVIGNTTKLNHGLVKKAKWVTSQEAITAIKAAQDIANAVYSVFGVSPAESSSMNLQYPLFVSLRYMKFSGNLDAPNDGHFKAAELNYEKLEDSFFLIITDEDIKELEKIDPFRAWRSEPKFQAGVGWYFTTHQLRRSLALYAQRSGLVSLLSLKRQLKHITEEMARYYARGSAFAKNFIGQEKDHFGLEWQNTQPESAALSYIINVLLNEEQLLGGHSSWVQHHQSNGGERILFDRADTLKRFQKGEMAYRETILGGCTNTGTCNKAAINWLQVDCIRDNCKNLVCSIPKLTRLVEAQTKMVGRLDKSSVEFRTEQQDLLILEAALIKANI